VGYGFNSSLSRLEKVFRGYCGSLKYHLRQSYNESFRGSRTVYSKLQWLFDSAGVANSMGGMCLAKTIVNVNYQ
jgi:hypothetical protein